MPKKGQFKILLGENLTNNQGYGMEIIESNGINDCTVKFSDGTIVYNKNYYRITSGSLKNPNHRIGEVHISTEGYDMTILECTSPSKYTILFNDERRTIKKNVAYKDIVLGNVKNLYHRSNYGVGYLGEGKYKNTINKIPTIQCSEWNGVLRRCFDQKFIDKRPTYKNTSICEEWECLQNFGAWFDEHYDPNTMKGWHLDKDILIKGNKHYSPENCVLVPPEINTLFIKSNSIRGKYPIGVSWNKERKKFCASIKINGEAKHLGYFNTPEEAFQVYKIAKEKQIKVVADRWRPHIENRLYQAMYNWIVEITD